jgi:hypothetical protein
MARACRVIAGLVIIVGLFIAVVNTAVFYRGAVFVPLIAIWGYIASEVFTRVIQSTNNSEESK